jgi:chemotaxis protein MotB
MKTRNRRHAVGTDRWMVSWADLLTLLFASIVVLYASAARNKPVKPEMQEKEEDELASPFDRLRHSLASEIAADKLQVSLETRGIVVSLRDQSYFQSGSDEIAPAALKSIGEVAAVIRDLPNSVRLEGHSDSVPIHNGRFRDNWSLSAARSAAVLSLLESNFNVPAARLGIAAYADNKPVAANESAEGRARNRRVDIVILSRRNI